MAYFDAILPKTTGTEILSMANESANASARDARSARIAELENELAEIRKQRGSLDTEADMGKYKFLYDADPSTYTSYQQNKRSAAQTEAIRKANEEATKASNAQTAWRQLLIDEETEKYKKIDAEDKAKKALADGNIDEYTEAMKQVKRSEATLARYARDKEQYRTKFNKMLGLSVGEQGQDGETGAPGVYDEEKDENLVNLKKYNEMVNGIDQEIINLRKRVTSMTDKNKEAIIDNANKVLEGYRNSDVGFLNDAQKTAWNKKIAEFEDAIPTFKKSQPTTMTPEKIKAAAKKAVFNPDGTMKNPAQLANLGAAKLRKYQEDYGWDLKKAIDLADRNGKK